jgi:hypothetical protein
MRQLAVDGNGFRPVRDVWNMVGKSEVLRMVHAVLHSDEPMKPAFHASTPFSIGGIL